MDQNKKKKKKESEGLIDQLKSLSKVGFGGTIQSVRESGVLSDSEKRKKRMQRRGQ